MDVENEDDEKMSVSEVRLDDFVSAKINAISIVFKCNVLT